MSSGTPPGNGNGRGTGNGRARVPHKTSLPDPQPPKAPVPSAPGSGAGSAARGAARTVKCPRCGKPARWEGNADRPFCSERCRLIDLGQWAEGKYAIPAEKVPDKGEDEE